VEHAAKGFYPIGEQVTMIVVAAAAAETTEMKTTKICLLLLLLVVLQAAVSASAFRQWQLGQSDKYHTAANNDTARRQ
jgi:hypothetical protein